MKTLVVGVGNPLRSDDAAGIHAAEAIEDLKLPETETRVVQQLNIELADELGGYDRVILVDAAEKGPGVELKEVTPEPAHENVSSHYFRPELLLAMTQRIYGHKPRLFLCSIQGDNFELGTGVSGGVLKMVKQAVQKIADLIKQ